MKAYNSPKIEMTVLSSEEVMFIRSSGNASEVANDFLDGMSISDFF